MDVRDISAIQPKKDSNDMSFKKSDGGQPQSKSTQGALNVMQDAEKMVKKANRNNMLEKQFMGDDIEDQVDEENSIDDGEK